MISFKKIPFLILCLIFINQGMAQSIILKLPIQDASFTSNQTTINFLWEDYSSSSWEIDIANNTSFIGASTYSINSTDYELVINTLTNQVYFWRIRNATDTSATRKFSVFSLSGLGSLVYHINAQNGVINLGGKISQWNNLANTQFNASQNNTIFQPELEISRLNNSDIVKFGGSSGNIATNLSLDNFLIGDTSFTFISSYQQVSLNTSLSYVLGNGSPRGGVFTGGTVGGGFNFGLFKNPSLIRLQGTTNLDWGIRSGNYKTLYLNTVAGSLNSTGLIDSLLFNTIGVRPDNPNLFFHGYLGDILIYNDILPDSSRLLVENYLRTKYTPFPDLGKDTVVCGPSIKIGFRSDHGYSSRLWNTGDTDVDSITITQNGTYWVTVESFGWTLTDTIVISGIVPKPSISLNNDTTICFADSLAVNYIPQSGFSPLWSTGESTNNIQVKESSTHVYLTHTDINNCSATSDSFFVKVDSLELLSTIGDDRNLCDGGRIFAESDGEGPFSYLWNTGDTTAFTTPLTLGSQNISVALSNFNNCVFRDTITVNAINLPAPNVAFSFDTACPNKLAQFNDLSSPGGTDNIILWQWIFNNTDSVFSQNASYAFAAGSSPISLTVETDSGCVNTLVKNYTSFKQVNAEINDVISCAQVPTLLTNNSSVAVPDFITNYEWFIDNQNYSGPTPEVSFPVSGAQEVILIATSNQNCTDTASRIIDVNPALQPDFTTDNSCIGDSTQFTDITSSFSTIDKLWDFGTGAAFSSDTMPSFLYTDTGNYAVKLTVENAIGCRNTITKNIRIYPNPKAIALLDNFCQNDVTLFYDSSQTEATSIMNYNWTINNRNFSGDSILLSFDTADNYTLNYEIVDGFACKDDTSFTFTIHPKPSIEFTFNPLFGEAPLVVDFTNTTDIADFYSWNFGENNQQSSDLNPSYTYTENGVYNVSLRAENQFGCIDSTQKTITVAPTELDLELSAITYTKTNLPNGDIAYTPILTVTNVGTRTVFNATFYAALDNDKNSAEVWTGSLMVGESIIYTFSSSIIISQEEDLSYLCGEITNVNSNTETLINNNKSCTILNGKLQTSLVYPNPTQENAFIDVISKENGKVDLAIIALSGKQVSEKTDIIINEGYNQLEIDCIHLQAGKYFVTISYEGEKYTLPLLVSNR